MLKSISLKTKNWVPPHKSLSKLLEMKTLTTLTFFAVFTTFSQLQTTVNTPNWLVENEFMGPNYTVTNATVTGAYGSIGQFDGTQCNVGLTRGIILSSGTILNTDKGPHGPNDYDDCSTYHGYPGNPFLTSIGDGTPTYDATIIEFDVIPWVDSIQFHYVFGSEEYPDFVGSEFNDVIAIAISGPGINGNKNLAVTPYSDPVNINNVNHMYNPTLYVDNSNGPTVNEIEFNGFTKNTFAKINNLQIGQTYHVFIGIADCADGGWDSGLFVEACENCNYNLNIAEASKNRFQLYPNPAEDYLTIQTEEEAQLRIVSFEGKIVIETMITPQTNSIDISSLPTGTYRVVLISNNHVFQQGITVN